MRRREASGQLHQRVVDVGRQVGDRAGDLASRSAMPAEEHCEAGDQVAHFGDVEPGPGARAERGDATGLQRGQVGPAVVVAHAVQEKRNLGEVLDDAALGEEVHQVGETSGLVAAIAAPDRHDCGVGGVVAGGVRLDRLRESERGAAGVGPVGRAHPAVVALDDRAVRAVVGGEPDGGAAGKALRELQDVSHRGAAEAIEALILVADDAQVAAAGSEVEQKLLLDMVGVLVLVDHHVADVARQHRAAVATAQQVEHMAL